MEISPKIMISFFFYLIFLNFQWIQLNLLQKNQNLRRFFQIFLEISDCKILQNKIFTFTFKKQTFVSDFILFLIQIIQDDKEIIPNLIQKTKLKINFIYDFLNFLNIFSEFKIKNNLNSVINHYNFIIDLIFDLIKTFIIEPKLLLVQSLIESENFYCFFDYVGNFEIKFIEIIINISKFKIGFYLILIYLFSSLKCIY